MCTLIFLYPIDIVTIYFRTIYLILSSMYAQHSVMFYFVQGFTARGRNVTELYIY